jgi:peptide/nickel transport system permease protein
LLTYLSKRILLFAPTLFVVAMVSFFLSKLAPGDPVEQFLPPSYTAQDYIREARRLGLDLPAFYFSITTRAMPDTLHRILPPPHRETLRRLAVRTGDWPAVQRYAVSVAAFRTSVHQAPDSLSGKSALLTLLQSLPLTDFPPQIDSKIREVGALIRQDSLLQLCCATSLQALELNWQMLQKPPVEQSIPALKLVWHGTNSQFHRWLFNFLCGDFGVSYADQRPVASRIGDAIFWTLILNLSAILLSFGISIPLGVWSAGRRRSLFDRFVTLGVLIFYSLPVFWVGTMLLMFFTTPEYGMDIFPSIGLGNLSGGRTSISVFLERAGHLILPILCLTYPSLAVITRQLRGAMIAELGKDYIRTAFAKGLTFRKVLWKHAFRNALFPLITLVSSVLPASIAGSVVIEVIFNIPGMGKLMVDAILQRDWPVVYSVLMLGAVLTVVGIILADLLYAWADPRVRYSKR